MKLENNKTKTERGDSFTQLEKSICIGIQKWQQLSSLLSHSIMGSNPMFQQQLLFEVWLASLISLYSNEFTHYKQSIFSFPSAFSSMIMFLLASIKNWSSLCIRGDLFTSIHLYKII